MGNSDHGTTCIRAGGDTGELRPWHCIYVYSIGSVNKSNGNPNGCRFTALHEAARNNHVESPEPL